MAGKVYLLDHLCCANCAAKIERAVGELPQVEQAVVVFPTKQLRVQATDAEGLEQEIQKIARSYEPDIVVTDRDASRQRRRQAKQEADHEHEHHHEHASPCS